MDLDSLSNIKLLALDVDGVLTDGRIWLDKDNEWKRQLSVRDGVGIKRLMSEGYQVAIITGSQSKDVQTRAKFLGIDLFYEGASDKNGPFEDLLQKTGLMASEVAYIGDDVFDVPLIKSCGFGATVDCGLPEAKQAADYVTRSPAGIGAVREVCELLIKCGYYSKK